MSIIKSILLIGASAEASEPGRLGAQCFLPPSLPPGTTRRRRKRGRKRRKPKKKNVQKQGSRRQLPLLKQHSHSKRFSEFSQLLDLTSASCTTMLVDGAGCVRQYAHLVITRVFNIIRDEWGRVYFVYMHGTLFTNPWQTTSCHIQFGQYFSASCLSQYGGWGGSASPHAYDQIRDCRKSPNVLPNAF